MVAAVGAAEAVTGGHALQRELGEDGLGQVAAVVGQPVGAADGEQAGVQVGHPAPRRGQAEPGDGLEPLVGGVDRAAGLRVGRGQRADGARQQAHLDLAAERVGGDRHRLQQDAHRDVAEQEPERVGR